MNLISISTDRKLFEEGSAVMTRQKEYAQSLDTLELVVFAKSKLGHKSFTKDNIKVYPTNSALRILYSLNAYQRAKRIIKQTGKAYSVTTQDPFETGLVGYWLKRKFGTPWQAQLRTDFLAKEFRAENFLNKVRYFIGKRLIKRVDTLRVVSNKIKDSILEAGLLDEEKIVVLPTYSEHPEANQAQVQSLKEKFKDFSKVVITVSRLSHEKNIPFILDVFKKTSSMLSEKVALVIVGEGGEKEKLEQKVKEEKIENVFFEGWQSQESLAAYYRISSVFMLASLYEGYGKVYIEAALQGLPIITTRVGVAQELIGQISTDYLVEQGEIQKATNALFTLLTNEPKRQDYAAKLRQKALEINYGNAKENYLQKLKESYPKK